MKKLITLLCCLLATSALFLACSKDESGKPDFKKLLTRENITFTPEVLTIKGQLISVEFTVKIPARFLPRKALLTLTPVLICDGDKEYKGEAKTWEGGRAGEGINVIPYDKATTVTLWHSFIYDDAMKDEYELYLEVNIIDGPLTSFRILVGKAEFLKGSI